MRDTSSYVFRKDRSSRVQKSMILSLLLNSSKVTAKNKIFTISKISSLRLLSINSLSISHFWSDFRKLDFNVKLRLLATWKKSWEVSWNTGILFRERTASRGSWAEFDFEVKIRVLRKFRKVLFDGTAQAEELLSSQEFSDWAFSASYWLISERTGGNSDPSGKLSRIIGESSNYFKSNPK